MANSTKPSQTIGYEYGVSNFRGHKVNQTSTGTAPINQSHESEIRSLYYYKSLRRSIVTFFGSASGVDSGKTMLKIKRPFAIDAFDIFIL